MISNAIKQNIVSQLLITATILTSGAILNVLQLLLYIFIRPFSKKLFNSLMYYIMWTWLAQSIFVYDFWTNSELIIHCKDEDFKYFGKEHNLAIFNHLYEIDFVIAWVILDKFKSLGYSRGFIKDTIKYIPIWGWFFGLVGHIFLKRTFDKDKDNIEDKICEYMTCNENTWIVLMAEGTRYTPEKYKNGIKFAKEKNIEPLKHHLVPRAKGFALSLPLLKKYKCPVVYNVQLSFDMNAKNPPHMASLIMGKKLVAHVYIDRIPIDNVEPTFESLYDIFKEKDALQDSFIKHGNYYEGRGMPVVEGHRMNRSILVLINAICWLLFEIFLILYSAKRMIDAEKVQLLTIVCISVIGVFYLMLKNILHLSNVSNSSHYGKSAQGN